MGEELERLGHTQDLLTLDSPDAPFLVHSPARVFAMGSGDERQLEDSAQRQKPLYKRFGFSSRAVPWIRRHLSDYDVAVVSGLWNYATVAARWGLVGKGIPYVVFTHGMLDPWFNEQYPMKALGKQVSWLVNEGPLLSHAYRVLFTSEEERLRARGVFKPYSVREEVVSYGASDLPADNAIREIAAFQAAVPQLGGRPFLLFLSRIHQKKGCDLLVNAFSDIANREPNLDLVIAGPDQTGLRAELEALARQRGVSSRIHWPGMLKGDEKWGAFRSAFAFVLPSHQENFGIVVAEAMACGLPVLISDKVNIWREVAASNAGFVAADTLDGTRDLLMRMLSLSVEERVLMSGRARNCFLENFNITNAARSLESVLQNAISSSSKT